MNYISPENEYPRHIGDVQLASPGWSLGDPLPAGWTEVVLVERPAQEDGKVVYEDFPVELNGVMTQNWQIREMTAEEVERKNAPITAKQKLVALGLTEAEIEALTRGLVR